MEIGRRLFVMQALLEDSLTEVQFNTRKKIFEDVYNIICESESDVAFYSALLRNFPAWVAWFFDGEPGKPLFLSKWQIEFADKLNEKDWAVALCSRKVGKSTLAALKALHLAAAKSGTRTIVIAPTEKQNAIFQMLLSFVEKSEEFKKIYLSGPTSTKAKLKVKLDNHSEILSRSIGIEGTGKLVLGEYGQYIIIDEIGDFPKGIYAQIILPIIADAHTKKKFFMIGTAKIDTNPEMDEMWSRWQESAEWATMSVDADEGVAQGCISRESVEEARKEMTDEEFKMWFYVVFPSRTGRFFPARILKGALRSDLKWYTSPKPEPGRTYHMAVDWGKFIDRTQIIVAERVLLPDGYYGHKYVWWEEIDPQSNYMDIDKQIKHVASLFKAFNCETIIPDATTAQDFYVERLVKEGVPSGRIFSDKADRFGYKGSGPGNWEMWKNHKAMLENGRIMIPGDNEKFFGFTPGGQAVGRFYKEHYEVQYSMIGPSGSKYGKLEEPKGGHMDLLAATAMLSLLIGRVKSPPVIDVLGW